REDLLARRVERRPVPRGIDRLRLQPFDFDLAKHARLPPFAMPTRLRPRLFPVTLMAMRAAGALMQVKAPSSRQAARPTRRARLFSARIRAPRPTPRRRANARTPQVP